MANTPSNEATNLEATEAPITRLGLSMFVILAGSFVIPLLINSSTLAIPAMALELRLDAKTISWFTLLQVLGSASLVLPAGKLADIYGRKHILCVGLIIAGIACIFGGAATTGIELMIGRCLQGIGGAFVFGSALALVSSVPPPEQKAKVMGVYVAIAYLGVVTGPLFGGFVVDNLNWRWVFYVPGVALLSIALIGWVMLDWERYGDRQTRLRFLDTVIYMTALSVMAFAAFSANTLNGQLLLLVGVLMFAAFCWFQTKRRDPLLQVTLFMHNPVYAILGITHFLAYSAILVLPFALTLYLQYIKGISAQTTGVVLISQAIVTALVAPTTGWFAERFRARSILLSGMLITLIAISCFYALSIETQLWQIIFGLGLIGLGVGVTDSQLIHVALNSVDEKLLGSASATLNGLRTMGGLVGMAIMSFLMNSYLGQQEIVPELYPDLLALLQQFFNIAISLIFISFSFLIYGIYRRAASRQSASR